VVPGVDVVAYGSDARLEYDLRIAPRVSPADLLLQISGAEKVSVDRDGDLVLLSDGREMRMRKPVTYREASAIGVSGSSTRARRSVDGGYVLEADGTVGFRVGPYDRAQTLVIDPSLSVGYSTFLGGEGDDHATSVALDVAGKIYIGGTTTSAGTFVETSRTELGSEGGNTDYFIAKIDPTKSGANSLVYLTFIGGSGTEAGGEIAVDSNGNVALARTTTSPDYPVKDSSTLTAGLGGVAVNDATITEVDPRRFVRVARSPNRRKILRRCAPLDDGQKRIVLGC
jgi:hypothetical protein